MAESARAVSELGRELHKRLGVLVGHVSRLGHRLDDAVRAYNDVVGSMEGRVLVTARRFEDLGAASSERTLPSSAAIERTARALTPPEGDRGTIGIGRIAESSEELEAETSD